MSTDKKTIHSGYVSIVGKPNVGKSTLLNQIIGNKISITSNSAQTTRGCVSGVYSGDDFAIKLIDTPGFVAKAKHLLDRALNKTVAGWLASVDLLLFVVDAKSWTSEDDSILSLVNDAQCPVFLVLNKVDLLKDKASLLPKMEKLRELVKCDEIIPVSATNNINVNELCASMLGYLPTDHPLESQIILSTPEEIVIAERIREKIFRHMSDEIPRSSAVIVKSIRKKKNVTHIVANIIVERKSHRQMILGKGGSKIKQIGSAARVDLEEKFGNKIYLELWVEVEENWTNSEKLLSDYQIFYNQQY